MPPRTDYPRPRGTDGTDGKYRMVIEDRYKLLALNRKSMRSFFYAIVILGVFRTSWSAIPMLVDGSRFLVSSIILSVLIVISAVLYVIGSGGNTPHKEKLPLLNLHAILNVLAITLVVYSAYVSNVVLPPDQQIQEKIAAYTAKQSGSPDTAHIAALGKALSYTLDGSLVVSLLASAAMTWYYISLKTANISTRKRD